MNGRLSPENANDFMDELDDMIDEVAEITDIKENFCAIASLMSMAMARIHFLPEDIRIDMIAMMKNQIANLEHLHRVVNLDSIQKES